MTVIKKFLDNNFYFWLIGFSFALISYVSIYESLVVNNSLIDANTSQIEINSRGSLSFLKQGISSHYFLIPINFIKLFSFFVIGQLSSIFILDYFYKINLASRYFIFFSFLLGCLIHYLFTKLF